jgi:hypothetical protein
MTPQARRRWRIRLSAGWWLLVALTLILAGGIGLLAWRPWDPRLPEKVVRKTVIARFAADGQPVRCYRSDSEENGPHPFGDVDYRCTVGEGDALYALFVGSDGKRITEISRAGP